MLIGNLTRDPELRYTTSGVPVCSFTIAVNRRFKTADGQRETDFFNVSAWRQLGELCANHLAKGRKVAVAGSVQTRNYEAKDGTKRTAVDVVADEVEFLTPREQGTHDAAQQGVPAGFTHVDEDELPF